MFLNIGILKRLMKQAYKQGLVVAQTEDRYYIAGSYWEMDVKREFMPKQILACLIELTGEIPEIGERFRATKEGNQQEMQLDMEVDASGFHEGIEVTKLMLYGKQDAVQRLLQTKQGDVYLLNNAFVVIADNSSVQEDRGEYRVTSPLFNATRGLLWANNVARFHAFWRSDENHERLIAEMSQIDLSEDLAE